MLKKILGSPLIQISLMAVLILAGMAWPAGLLEDLENNHYDWWSARFRAPDFSSVAIVAIDAKSVRQLGDWPWPRSRIAEMVALLSGARAEAQGVCLLYTLPDENPGLAEIKDLRSRVSDPHWRGRRQNTKKLLTWLNEAQEHLSQDDHLITAVRRARNTVLPMRFSPEKPVADEEDRPSGLLVINSLKPPAVSSRGKNGNSAVLAGAEAKGTGRCKPIAAESVQETFSDLAGKAGGLGHINVKIDPDGVVRRVPLLVGFSGRLYPALALQLAVKQIDAKLRNITIAADFAGRPRLRIKHLELSTDGAFHMLVDHDPRWLRERTYSFAEVLDGTLDADLFKNKVVLIGITDPDIAPVYRVGTHNGVSMVEIEAGMLARILSKVRLSRPPWALFLEIVALLYFAFFLIVVIPRVSIRLGAAILAVFLVTWYAIGLGLLLGYGYWIKIFGPSLLACAGFIGLQFTIHTRMRQQDKMESNKTLGLSYQGQGMFDMAYEKYMQCPVEDESVKNLLYNLGLDFERKRMFNKAAAIYRHILTAGNFKDLKERITRLNYIDDPLAMTGNFSVSDGTIKVDDTNTKPTFGRYEILRELGHGAMGTVYLGRDPKINRKVAIKTLEYAQVDGGELEEIKTRFFREAEAAGMLSHPNIVSIFDAGEEHDMAYIAMELLIGDDLTRYCAPDNLLPVGRILSIISDVTMALDYAHRQGVVHRDIKPGNIMLLEDGRIKVTDFGIARVVDASQTRSGIVLGTPSYMSPEQVAGKDVDGRSDLFTLGIVLYQLLTGAKPFIGDTITAIMYAITNHAYTPLSEAAPEVPPCVERIVDQLLAKALTKRFKSAAQLSKALNSCIKSLPVA